MTGARAWVRLVATLVPGDERRDWIEEWNGELAAYGGTMKHAWGALADAWYLRSEGWTMDGVARDIRTAVRGLIRRPLFTVVAGLTLAVGIGANTAIFSVVDGVLLNPLPFPEADRLVSYNHEAPGLGVTVPVIPHSHAMYLHYVENARALESFTVIKNGSVTMVDDAGPRQLTVTFVTEQYFDVFGVHPMLGRGFVEGEDRPGSEPVVVLSHSLWEQSFGRDPAVLGQLVEMAGVRRRVVGVMPPDFAVLDEDAWLPLEIDVNDEQAGALGLIGIGRLADGETPESADAEMHDLLMRFVDANPEELPRGIIEEAGLDSDVKPLKELLVGERSSCALGAAGHGGDRAADRVCERGQPLSRSGGIEAA